MEHQSRRRVDSLRAKDIIHMSLHPQLLAKAPVTSRSGIFRLKALFSEQRARESIEPRSRADWEELAIEWHMMANLAAGANEESNQIDVS
jgi:hypothetical protein